MVADSTVGSVELEGIGRANSNYDTASRDEAEDSGGSSATHDPRRIVLDVNPIELREQS